MSTLSPQNLSNNINGTNNVPAGKWQGDLLVKLLVRDRREKAFTDFVESYNALVQKLGKFADRNSELESSEKATAEKFTVLSKELEILKHDGSPLNQKKTAELELEIQQLKDERSENYKTQAQNAQRLLTMNDRLQSNEEAVKKYQEEVQTLTDLNQVLNVKVEDYVQVTREKDLLIQVLHDELAALQLELNKVDERMRSLENENSQLLQRWLKKMNEEAEIMNKANSFYETIIAEAQSKDLELPNDIVVIEKDYFSNNPVSKSGKLVENEDNSQRTKGKATGSITIPMTVFKKFVPSPNGKLFATGSADKTIKVYDITTGNVRQTLTGSAQSVTSVSFNDTSEMIVGASNDNSARLWLLRTGRTRLTLTGHIGKVYSAKFNCDSTRVASN
ncbi:10688_t:CDS:10 [Entrophospora sp. SA101]|nr:10688_t:CDS:10 [Entrophospora sp. SA101]